MFDFRSCPAAFCSDAYLRPVFFQQSVYRRYIAVYLLNRTGSAFAVFRYRYQILAHLDFRQIARYGVYVFKYKAYQRIFFTHHARQRIALARHVEHHPFAHARRQCAQQQRRYNQILFHLFPFFCLVFAKIWIIVRCCSKIVSSGQVPALSVLVGHHSGFYVVSLTETIISRHALYLRRVRSVDRRTETAPHRKGHFRRGRSHFHSAAVLHGLRQGVARQFVRHRRRTIDRIKAEFGER